jgi:hypothetical protein
VRSSGGACAGGRWVPLGVEPLEPSWSAGPLADSEQRRLGVPLRAVRCAEAALAMPSPRTHRLGLVATRMARQATGVRGLSSLLPVSMGRQL